MWKRGYNGGQKVVDKQEEWDNGAILKATELDDDYFQKKF